MPDWPELMQGARRPDRAFQHGEDPQAFADRFGLVPGSVQAHRQTRPVEGPVTRRQRILADSRVPMEVHWPRDGDAMPWQAVRAGLGGQQRKRAAGPASCRKRSEPKKLTRPVVLELRFRWSGRSPARPGRPHGWGTFVYMPGSFRLSGRERPLAGGAGRPARARPGGRRRRPGRWSFRRSGGPGTRSRAGQPGPRHRRAGW